MENNIVQFSEKDIFCLLSETELEIRRKNPAGKATYKDFCDFLKCKLPPIDCLSEKINESMGNPRLLLKRSKLRTNVGATLQH